MLQLNSLLLWQTDVNAAGYYLWW